MGAANVTGVAVGDSAVGGAGAEVPAAVGNGIDVAAVPPQAAKSNSSSGGANNFIREIATPMVLPVQRKPPSHGVGGCSALRLPS